jgi:hypothetical protein
MQALSPQVCCLMVFCGLIQAASLLGSGLWVCFPSTVFGQLLSSSLVITGVLTVIFAGYVYFLFPDSPLHAKFLTYEERGQAILRIKKNHSGIEQKLFKRYQSEDLVHKTDLI